jgi:hypothetical protein
VYLVDGLPDWNVSDGRGLVPELWQRTCGVSEIQPSPGPCHVDFTGVGGKSLFQELQAMLPKPGKRLVCRDTDMKNRLEMKPSMSITCHAVAVSSLDPFGPALWHEVLPLGYNHCSRCHRLDNTHC